MVKFWYIDNNFIEIRSNKIGASDIPGLIPNPEKLNESLAAYGRTPLTIWEEKTGRIKREPAGLPAEMGHFLENKAIELFIKEFGLPSYEIENLQYKIIAEMENEYLDKYQCGRLLYHTQYYENSLIAHPDAVYIPVDSDDKIIINGKTTGIKIDISKPFILEAKSASYFSSKRPEDSLVTGYDFNLKGWQGIPLKHYMQIQFQLLLFKIDIAYLALISNTSEFHIWEIKANRKYQKEILKIANHMVSCITFDQPPKELIFNQEDIKSLYPNIKNDFIMYSGKEQLENINNIIDEYKKAIKQEKKWKEKADEAKDAISVIMKDHKELRDKTGVLASWILKEGSEKITALSEIKKQHEVFYNMLKEKNLIYKSKDSKYIKIK